MVRYWKAWAIVGGVFQEQGSETELFEREDDFGVGPVEFFGVRKHSGQHGLKLRRLLSDSGIDLGVLHIVVKFEAKLVDAISEE